VPHGGGLKGRKLFRSIAILCVYALKSVADLGIAGPRTKITCETLVKKSLSVFTCFLVISFQFFFSDSGPLLGYQKRRAIASLPPKAATE